MNAHPYKPDKHGCPQGGGKTGIFPLEIGPKNEKFLKNVKSEV